MCKEWVDKVKNESIVKEILGDRYDFGGSSVDCLTEAHVCVCVCGGGCSCLECLINIRNKPSP